MWPSDLATVGAEMPTGGSSSPYLCKHVNALKRQWIRGVALQRGSYLPVE